MRPRGATPSPRHVLAAARPHTPSRDVPAQLIVCPPNLQWWGNNQYGDCVSAEEAYALLCGGYRCTDQDLEAWARKHGVLGGADLQQVLRLRTTYGLPAGGREYTDGAAQSVDWTREDTLRSAIASGPVKIACAATQLEAAVGATNGWCLTGAKPDNSIDHCVSLSGFGPLAWLAHELHATLPGGVDGTQPGYALFTWSTVGLIDRPSLLAINPPQHGEAWLRAPTSIDAGPVPPGPEPDPRPRPCHPRLAELLVHARRFLDVLNEG